jgi:hypothetical protein
VVRLETRPANIEGKGAVKARNLLINSLRMRPDRIVVGEVRGEEALDMLQAMNTGHDGSLTTIHANTPRDGLGRLEVFPSGDVGAARGLRRLLRLSPRARLEPVIERFGTHRGYLYFCALGGALLEKGLIHSAPGPLRPAIHR